MLRNRALMILLVLFLIAGLAVMGCEAEDAAPDDTETDDAVDEVDEVVDEWPTKPITIVTPYSAGGGTDRLARTLAPFLQEELGVPVLVENRAGGGGIVGTEGHVQAGPDDCSEFIFQLQPYVSAGILRGGNYTLEDLAFIGNVYGAPQAIWVRADSDWDTMEEFVEALQTTELSYPYIPGSYMVLGPLMLQEIFNPDGRDMGIPYDGAGPARTAFLGGHVDYINSDLYSTAATVGDDAYPLAVFASERDSMFPDVPTVNEVLEGMGVDEELPELANIYFAMIRQEAADSYPERYQKIVDAFEASMSNPDLIELYERTDVYTSYLGPDDLEALVYAYDNLIQQYSQYWVE